MGLTKAQVQQKMFDIISDQLWRDERQINPTDTFFEDLGTDSLDAVELVMAVEDEFDIELADEEIEKVSTVQQALDLVFETLGKKKD